MTSFGDDQTPANLKRSLTLRFSSLLLLFLALSGGSYVAVSSAVSAKEYDSVVVNVAGRQRMLIQKYTREINQVLFGLAVADWEMAVRMKEAASKTADCYETTLAALSWGGEVEGADKGRFWIPPAQGADIIGHLQRVRTEWGELRRTAIRAMRSDNALVARNDHVRRFHQHTNRAVAEMDHVVSLLQEQSEAKLRRVGSYMKCAFILSLVLLLVTVVFVRSRIVAPLDRSVTALGDAIVRAERADRAKSEFLANMSHEIRTPMTAILGFAENLLDRSLSETERLTTVHTIHRSGESLLRIINDILDLSKIEAGKVDAERIACEPCRIIAEVLSLVRVPADAKGLPLDFHYDGPIPNTIHTDPVRLRQILINLVGNAIKFTDAGTVRLVTRFVDAGEDDREGNPQEPRLQFDVIDTGRGIPAEETARLFQPFVQADTSATRKFGGTGLGLTISKRFAELLGGDLFVVETRAGVGSTFRVTVATGSVEGVKMLEDPRSATVVADAGDTGPPADPPDLRGLRLLFAEDGPDNQRLISFVLRKAGADVTVQENGKLALEAALAARDEGNPFDCILMDMQMPVMDGYEATGQLRRQGYTGAIIALTAHAMASDREKCIQAGCDDYATKPINRAKLIETIRQHLARAEAAPAAAS